MFKSERHEKIVNILKEKTFASVPYIAEQLFVSLPTVRRDLTFLEEQGYVKRSHGGAILADRRTDIPLPFRSGTKSREKQRICRAASKLIKDGNVIFTDASSTVLHIAELLSEREDITLVTNGLGFAERLSQSKVRLYATGGRVLSSSHAFVGQRACDFLGDFNADIMFFSSSSLSPDGTVSDYSEEETLLRRQMMNRSRIHVFMCDSTKFGRTSAFRLCSIKDVDYVISDFPLPENILKEFCLEASDENGIFVYKALC